MTDGAREQRLEQHIARIAADPAQYVWVMTKFPEDVTDDGRQETYGGEGCAETVLASITDGIWVDYCLRRGHATAMRIPDSPGQFRWDCSVEPDWRAYRVFLGDGVPLDISKTLGELGLVGRGSRVQVRFERATVEGATAP